MSSCDVPESWNVHRNEHALGVEAIHAGRYGEACQHLRKAILQDPLNSDCRYNLAIACAESGDIQTASLLHQQCLKKDPNFELSHMRLPRLLEELGDLDGAKLAHEIACQSTFYRASCLHNYGAFQYRHGDILEATLSLCWALNDPKCTLKTHRYLSDVLVSSEDWASAETVLRQAQLRYGPSQELLLAFSDLYCAQDRFREALDHVRGARRLGYRGSECLLRVLVIHLALVRTENSLHDLAAACWYLLQIPFHRRHLRQIFRRGLVGRHGDTGSLPDAWSKM